MDGKLDESDAKQIKKKKIMPYSFLVVPVNQLQKYHMHIRKSIFIFTTALSQC